MFYEKIKLLKFKSLSLVTKLMLFYSLSTISILSAISLFLYPTFIKIIESVNGNDASHIAVECYEKIIIGLLFASLSAIILGYIVARNGLNRMREFENKIEQITADSLHERIHINEWPKELKRVGKKFNMMLDRIQTSFLQLSQFSSDIAHELRTPINNLRGVTEIALSKKREVGEYRKILEANMAEYEHISKLIENLLFLARSDHGHLILKKEAIHTQKEILNICAYYQAMADENHIDLICNGDAEIFVDPTLFKRVMSNLISNALKYTLPNGKISIDINVVGKWINISICDTGIGIADEHMARVFDRFYRVDYARSSSADGLGLGLAIVKSIVNLHNGKLTIKSKPNLGTTVFLKVPALPSE